MIKISVIIPVKNGEQTIKACLDAIFAQTLINQTEIIIIDSGSTDQTLDIVKQYPVKLYQIPPKEFGHGKTRNYGVTLAQGEFIQFTVQDAQPASKDWLETMLQNFEDEELAAVCGQQAVPHHKDKNPVEWFRPVSKPGKRTVQYKQGAFEKLPPCRQHQECTWDDVNAMYRKTILNKLPFDEVAFGEDMLWAKNALIQGYKIAYDMRARVWHYHHYTDMQKLRHRIHYTLYFTYQTFACIHENPYTVKKFLQMFYKFVKFKIAPKWWFYNIKLFIFSAYFYRSGFNKIRKKQ